MRAALGSRLVACALRFRGEFPRFQVSAEDKKDVMTKADLIDEVSRLAELTRKDSEVIVETIFDSVVRSLRAGDKIEIRGFGSFRTRQRKPRVGRNPKTGERVEVPAKKIPFFKPSKELKDLVNEAAAGAEATPVTTAPPTTSVPPSA
jgi:integration host factor subunit beta